MYAERKTILPLFHSSGIETGSDKLTHFKPVLHFYTPSENVRKPEVLNVFMGYRNGTWLEIG